MKPSEKLNSFILWLQVVGEALLGAGNKDGVLLPKGIIIMVCLGAFLEVMHINGIYHYLSQPAQLSSLIAISTLFVQLIVSLINRLMGNESERLFTAYEILQKFVMKEEKNVTNSSILMSSIDSAIYILKCYMPISFLLYHTPITTAVVISILKREYIMAFHVFYPYIDPNALYGYLFNMALQTLASTMIFCLLSLRDINLIFYPLQTRAMVKVHAVNVKTYAEKLMDFRKKKRAPKLSRMRGAAAAMIDDIRRRKQLKELEFHIIKSMVDFNEMYNDFISHFKAYNTGVCFVIVLLNSMAIGLSLFYMKKVSIPIGLAVATLLLFQVFVPCVIGTVISTQNEKLLQMVCDFPWYELSPAMQKTYLQFIHLCQNANEFEVPLIGNLNMHLFTDVMNASYSYWNYLLEFG